MFLLPVLLIPKASAFYYEHRLYLPIIGMLIVFVNLSLVSKRTENLFSQLLVALIVIFGITSFLYSQNFSNKFRFWENAVNASPNAVYPNKVLAAIYKEEKKPELAQQYYEKTLLLNPSELAIRNDLAVIYMEKNDYAKAKSLLEEELKINSTSDKVNFNYARTLYQLKQLPDAEKYWLKAAELNTSSGETYQCLAIVNADMKNFDKARNFAHQAEAHNIPVPEDFWKAIGGK